MKKILIILTPILIVSACRQIALGPETPDNPVNNFELFWDDYDKHSGIIFPKKINWDSVYRVYQPMVTDQTTESELWIIFKEMIEAFDDEHTFIENPVTGEFHVSGSEKIGPAIESFSKTVIQNNYLENTTILDTLIAPDMSYGKIKDKEIGYIYLGDTDGAHPEYTMDMILEEIGSLEAIIFDVRNNGGGEGSFALGITAAFAEKTQPVFSSQTRNGPAHDDFDEKTFFSNINDGENQYLKPVIVLSDRFTVSGAEHITLNLRLNSQITHMGDTTAGAFSSTSNRRFLPNGWLYQYPAQMSLTPDGISLDNDGLVPDITVRNTPGDVAANRDVVIEAAIQYLFDTYGID